MNGRFGHPSVFRIGKNPDPLILTLMTRMETLKSARAGTVSTTPARVVAIDLVRALTMVLMIFVNDLWSLKDIPRWLEHVPRGVDGIGLADVVFPAFLFIVGLSLPYALDARRRKGDTAGQLVGHVLTRSVALLVMGVFLVNGESINEAATGMPRLLYNTLCCIAFILIWNVYPKTAPALMANAARAAGILVLLGLAFVYRGGKDGDLERFAPQWWGILGLIGWSYLAAGLVTVFARNRLAILIAGWVVFSLLSIISHAELLPKGSVFYLIPNAISGGTLAGLTMGGVVIGTLFRMYRERNDHRRMAFVFLGISVFLIALSVLTRPYWGLAKLGATPAWLFLCSAFTILAFLAVYRLADLGGKAHWFRFIRPAGTDTLLCYLIPYFAYAFTNFMNIRLPEAVLTGGVGLLKSFLFALLCVWITGGLSRVGIRLKL
ncbi:heparan-alpha-glucosaminide N-acetyltransferase domain-containing protein [Larkinella soli]|uniref:heparan-alpha-glucosaminide N-acetyltransferase domain-containing protein n=1 Tax=Larkinella soli TaxID=1770527 RepID=UPI001E5C4641|nr:DUF5009 domain-containing protein [Larkinella soli]